MSNQWFVHADGKQMGPLSPAELKSLVDEGQVTAETPVRLGAEGKWVRAGRVKGLLPDTAPTIEARRARPLDAAVDASEPRSVPVRQANSGEVRDASRGAPSAVVPPSPPRRSSREPLPFAAHAVSALNRTTQPPPRRTARDLGIGAIILGLAGVAAFFLPLLGLPLAAIGVVLGLAGLITAFVQRQGGVWVSFAGMVVSITMFVVGWIFAPEPPPDLATLRDDPGAQDGAMVGAEIEQAETEWANFAPDIQWLDPSARGVLGDIEVQIESVQLMRPMIDDLGEVAKSENKMLVIRLWLRNTSRSTSVVYLGWSGAGSLVDTHEAKLQDHRNLPIRPPRLSPGTRIEGQLVNQAITPAEQVPDLLVFVPPAVSFEYLQLELPGEAIGASGKLHYRIPANMIETVED